MGSVVLVHGKKGKKYRARVFDDFGKPIYKTFERKREAELWISEQEIKKDKEGLSKKDKGVLFEEYSAWWLKERIGKVANRSIENWESNLRLYINPFFYEKRIGLITYQDGLDFQRALSERGISPRTNNHIIQIFKQIIIYATKGQGYRKQLHSNPLLGIEKLSTPKGSLVFWEKCDVVKFLTETKEDYYYDVYLFAVYTGARLGEIAGLQRSKVDLSKRIVTFSNALKRESGKSVLGATKTGNTRHFPIGDSIFEMLKNRCSGRAPGDLVFCDKDGGPLDIAHFSRIFSEAQKRAGVKKIIRFHDLRHTFASNFIMSFGDLYTLQKLLGHSRIETTEIYAHLSASHFKSVANVLDFSGEKK